MKDMSILAVGSVAYDNLETPSGRRIDVLGGAATHFSTAASFFSKVHMVGVVGGDFDPKHIRFFNEKGIDTEGLKVVPEGRTFRWDGHYMDSLDEAKTLDTKIGVFATFDPELSNTHKGLPYLFLANIHPKLQLKVLRQMQSAKFKAMDTMNLWIDTERRELQKVIENVDLVFVNETEARLLTKCAGARQAAKRIMGWGPKFVVIKRGGRGAVLFTKNEVFSSPAYPVKNVVDPTGAGDTFAGGFMGYLARMGEPTKDVLRGAVIAGTVMSSFQVEDFGLERLRRLTMDEFTGRVADFRELSQCDAGPLL